MNTLNVTYMNPNFLPLLLLLLLLSTFGLQGCTQHQAFGTDKTSNPGIYGDVSPKTKPIIGTADAGPLFIELDCRSAADALAPQDYRADNPLYTKTINSPHAELFNRDISLSPGDLIEILIENGEGFSGRYQINSNGYLSLPLLESIKAVGLTAAQLNEKIQLSLIKNEIFRANGLSSSTQILKLSEIEVSVSGAVFSPGRVLINDQIPAQVMKENTAAAGDHNSHRMLSESLRAASGVRPDAKLDQIKVIRQGYLIELDLSGILTGQPVNDIPLVAGDQVIVPSTGCFQPHLVRPSQITPKGFRVFMSNLIEPSSSNANAAVGSFSSNIPYGTRLLQAVVSANCVGGKQWTNAPRKVVLASHNPLTGKTQVVERSIEQLMRFPEMSHINPYLMPNDSVACYDSDVANLRDIANFVSDLLNPFAIRLE